MATGDDDARSETKPDLAVAEVVFSSGPPRQIPKDPQGASPGPVAARATQAADALLDQQLRDQHFYTRLLIGANVGALATTDRQGMVTDVNQQMMSMTARTRAQLLDVPFRDLFTDPTRVDEALARVLAGGEVSDVELTVRALDGLETDVACNAAAFFDRHNTLLGVFAVARDVTDRRRIERAMMEKNLELEHASRVTSQFLVTMSHELRTPLNSVIGFSEALRDGLLGELTESQREYIGDIFAGGQHLLSLINNILDLSRLEAGMMDLELEDADVGQLLAESLSIVRDKASARHIALDLKLDEDLGVTELDARKTRQIVENLLANAVKFSDRGGRVSLHARRVPRSSVGTLDVAMPAGAWPSRRFSLPSSEFAEFVEIRVTDAGIGISAENLAKLFEPFTQIDSGPTRRFEGTGLGLAMVRQMTELLGGSVAITSSRGEGTCVAAWIPLRTGASHIAIAVDVGSARAAEPKDLVALVVEDDDDVADLVRILLNFEGFTVLRARSAGEALRLAPEHGLDLIALDIQLPGIDGWEFLASIREDTRLRAVPVVVVCGSERAPLALGAGACAVLQKPISRVDLKGALAGLGFHDAQDRTCTVLVVDDDRQSVALIAAYLPSPAYATVPAYGGQEAIVAVHRVLPDVIVLDLVMPDVDGFDVVRAVRSDPSTSGIPILVVTARQLTARDRQALNTDPSNFMYLTQKAGFNGTDFMAEVRRARARR